MSTHTRVHKLASQQSTITQGSRPSLCCWATCWEPNSTGTRERKAEQRVGCLRRLERKLETSMVKEKAIRPSPSSLMFLRIIWTVRQEPTKVNFKIKEHQCQIAPSTVVWVKVDWMGDDQWGHQCWKQINKSRVEFSKLHVDKQQSFWTSVL